MSSQEVDEYLAAVPEPKRSTLEQLRRDILEIQPDAEQCISYSMPAFRLNGKVIAGFAAFKNHLAYLPHSGKVFPEVEELAGFEFTNGSLHFEVDVPLPRQIIERLIAVRMQQLGFS